MLAFFTILFILIGVNALMMVFSFVQAGQKLGKVKNKDLDSKKSRIYPIGPNSSKYKKAV